MSNKDDSKEREEYFEELREYSRYEEQKLENRIEELEGQLKRLTEEKTKIAIEGYRKLETENKKLRELLERCQAHEVNPERVIWDEIEEVLNENTR